MLADEHRFLDTLNGFSHRGSEPADSQLIGRRLRNTSQRGGTIRPDPMSQDLVALYATKNASFRNPVHDGGDCHYA